MRKSNANARREGLEGEVDFCRFAITHGKTIGSTHRDVIAELGLAPGIRELEPSSPYDVYLKGAIPALFEVKRRDGPTDWEEPPHDDGPCDCLEEHRLDKLLALTNRALVYCAVQYGPGSPWAVVDIPKLDGLRREGIARCYRTGPRAKSFYNGKLETMPTWYWPVRFFRPLESIWPQQQSPET